jgi:hypothetical protein
VTDRAGDHDEWDAGWESARRELLKSTLAATPAQRLAWLEEALEFAFRAGAIGNVSNIERNSRSRD